MVYPGRSAHITKPGSKSYVNMGIIHLFRSPQPSTKCIHELRGYYFICDTVYLHFHRYTFVSTCIYYHVTLHRFSQGNTNLSSGTQSGVEPTQTHKQENVSVYNKMQETGIHRTLYRDFSIQYIIKFAPGTYSVYGLYVMI